MKQEIIQIELKASMEFTSLQWRNQTRLFFENWAMKIASEHCVLLDVRKFGHGIKHSSVE